MLHKTMQLHNITVVIIDKGMSQVRNNTDKTKQRRQKKKEVITNTFKQVKLVNNMKLNVICRMLFIL